MRTATASAEPRVVWKPHPGSQALFLTCPIWECLYTGTRGPGKTDALLMDFARHVGQGWGADWRGVLFRHEYKPLDEVIKKSTKWFRRIFPGARFLKSAGDLKWVFPAGEELLFRAFKSPDQYWDYHGHEYPWIGWEELTAWPSLACYHVMKSCNRSSRPGIPRKYRATCNPYGPGHNAVKAYFIDPAPAGVPFQAERSDVRAIAEEFGVQVEASGDLRTVCLHGHYSENRTLMSAQADYPALIASAAENPEQAKAWLHDDWDIVSGGMFDDVWRPAAHMLPPFAPPPHWTLFRAYDHGETKPFSLGWWLRANGEAARMPDGSSFCPPAGSLVRWAEWYGWDGKTPNVGLRMAASEIGRQAKAREKDMGVHGRVFGGPADSSIFDERPGETSPADALARSGITFKPAEKGPGSRKRGWSKIRDMLAESSKPYPEGPGLWVVETCRQFIRTIPTLPRSSKDPDDVDTDAEDHVGDETRYAVQVPAPTRALYIESPWG
jgi:hypothetical protein